MLYAHSSHMIERSMQVLLVGSTYSSLMCENCVHIIVCASNVTSKYIVVLTNSFIDNPSQLYT